MTDENCLFCKIYHGKVGSEKVYEDEKVLGFRDINPVAKTHILFIHRNHTKNINDLLEQHPKDLTDLFKAIKIYTQENQIDQKGFRVVNNMGKDGGQTIFHTHFHLLAGERLPW